MVHIFSVVHPYGPLDLLYAALQSRGVQIDSFAELCRQREETGPLHAAHCVILTPHDLGYPEHPTLHELHDREVLAAWSKKKLPPGRIIAPASAETFLQYLNQRPESKKGDRLAMCTESVSRRGVPYVLQYVHSAANERWLYGVPFRDTRRWSKTQQFLFEVRDANETEKTLLNPSWIPLPIRKLQRKNIRTASFNPDLLDDLTPGKFCGSMAAKHVLAAVNPDMFRSRPVEYFTGTTPLAKVLNRTGHMFPWQLAARLRQAYLRASTHYPRAAQLEAYLDGCLARRALAIVLCRAQRRRHGEHFVIVGASMEIGRHRYWCVTDGQFARDEYPDLPNGNVLLEMEDFLRSSIFYLAGRFAVVEVAS